MYISPQKKKKRSKAKQNVRRTPDAKYAVNKWWIVTAPSAHLTCSK